MQRRIGILDQGQQMVGAVLFEKEIIEVRVPQFPGMHKQTRDLMVCKVQPVFPDIAVLNVAVFLDLEVVGNRREVAAVAAKDAADRIGQAGIRRHVRRIVDRVGQNPRLFCLALLVYPKQRMPKHRRGIVHEGGREDERDRLGLEVCEPALEPFAGHRWEAMLVETQSIPQPGIPGDKRALSRLLRPSNEFIGKKLLQRRIELRLRIDLPVRRHEESGVVLLADIAPPHILAIVKQQMPLSLASKLSLDRLTDEFRYIEIARSLLGLRRRRMSEKQADQENKNIQAAGQKDAGPRP